MANATFAMVDGIANLRRLPVGGWYACCCLARAQTGRMRPRLQRAIKQHLSSTPD